MIYNDTLKIIICYCDDKTLINIRESSKLFNQLVDIHCENILNKSHIFQVFKKSMNMHNLSKNIKPFETYITFKSKSFFKLAN